MEQKDYREAADLFERLAELAARRTPLRAAHLYFEAGQARLLDGAIDSGMQNLAEGASLLASSGHYELLARISQRLLEELRRQGLEQEAAVWARKLDDLLEASPTAISPEGFHAETALPAKCPYCGGSLHPGEVERVGTDGALCSYCGSVVSGDS
jgi:hypothetical protein